MKKAYTYPTPAEPIGIVISRGASEAGAPEAPKPMFSAYIWGPAPDPADEASRAA